MSDRESAQSDDAKNLWRNRGKRKLKPAESALCFALGLLSEREVELVAERTRNASLEEALRAGWPVVNYVSAGRGYIGVDPYPDARARKANALIVDALSENQASKT